MRTDRFAAESVTLGTYADDPVCFFGAGLLPSDIPTEGTVTYTAYADGLVSDGTVRRLFLVSQGTVVFATDDDEATVNMTFRALADPEGKGPFLDISGRDATDLITATATLDVSGATLKTATFTGSDGYTGTIYGSFVGKTGIVLPFTLAKTTGEVIYGVIAADSGLGG
ncbi:hypothetical protein B2G71_02405 [Novosphingobium sp. PC22D]|nr:hypothetical protein B2G71_02405 [Novosphingobium sp. PC22D]